MIDDRPVILFISGSSNGCNMYRITNPASKIIEKDLFPCALSRDLSQEDLNLWIEKSDVIVTQGFMSEKFLEFMKENKGKKKFVIDSDDNIFSVTPYNPSYQFHGFREVNFHLPDGKTVKIRDGEGGFDIQANLKRLAIAKESMTVCDLITTPSSVLAGFYKKFNKNVRVIKNFIDFSVWQKHKLVKDGFIRIVWQGGHSHYEDWVEVSKPLCEVMKMFKNVKLIIMGQHFKGTTLEFPQDRIEVHPWVTVEAYPYKFMLLNADIGIAPLKNDLFSTCKSEIKWEEYSSIGLPSVMSNIPPYSLNVSHGTTGFLASNDSEWIEYLSLLIESKDARQTVGDQVREVCIEKYDLDNEIQQYKVAYDSLFKKELILV